MSLFVVTCNRTQLLMVRLHQVSLHCTSGLPISLLKDAVIAIVPWSYLGAYVVFCPWTDRETKQIVADKLCVITKLSHVSDSRST